MIFILIKIIQYFQMKKILFVCDGDHFSSAVFDYARAINKQEKILLKGFFMPSIDYSRMPSYAYANSYEGLIPPDFYEEEDNMMEQSIAQFEDLCKTNNISYNIYKHTGFESLQGLLDETRFSDIALVGSTHFLSVMDKDQPNMEMVRLLHDTECPVLLVPEKFKEAENILFAYDGEASCMAAFKQFHLLMTQYSTLPFTIVYFSLSGERLPNEDVILEYVKCHYPHFKTKTQDSQSVKNLDEWLAAYSNPVIITGSYSRSSFSRMFRRSFISTVIAHHQFPVFLFHGNKR